MSSTDRITEHYRDAYSTANHLRTLLVDFDAFRQFVAENIDWFRGRLPESNESFALYEEALGCMFPRSIKWLLTTHGYWHGTGIPNLGEAVKLTLDCRNSISLPERYIILDDRGDVGVTLLDTADYTVDDEVRVHDVESHRILEAVEANTPLVPDVAYESYGDFVAAELVDLRNEIDPKDVKYNAAEDSA